MNDNQYNYQGVLAILAARSKVIDWYAYEEQVKQLCAMACAQTATSDYVVKHEGTEMDFENGTLYMPSGTIRIERVRTLDGARLRWRKVNGLDIQILDYTAGTVKVDWWEIPADEQGLLPISYYQLDYCVAVCEFYIMRDAWLNKTISRIDMEVMKEDMRRARIRASAKRISVDEMEAGIWLMRNGIRFPNADVLKTL